MADTTPASVVVTLRWGDSPGPRRRRASIGEGLRIVASFVNGATSAAIDVDDCAFFVVPPDGIERSIAAADILHLATGSYAIDQTPDSGQEGTWQFRVACTSPRSSAATLLVDVVDDSKATDAAYNAPLIAIDQNTAATTPAGQTINLLTITSTNDLGTLDGSEELLAVRGTLAGKTSVGAVTQAAADSANAVLADLTARVDDLTPAPVISTLSTSPSTSEKGSTVAGITVAWTLSKTVVSQTVAYGTTVVDVPAGTLGLVVSGPFTTDQTYTLTVTDSLGKSAVGTVSSKFQDKLYWGPSANEALTSSEILALSGGAFGTALGSRSISYDCSGGKYPYLAYPAAWGDPSNVQANGLPIAGLVFATVTHTNASGLTSQYRTVRFANIQNGSSIPVVWQ